MVRRDPAGAAPAAAPAKRPSAEDIAARVAADSEALVEAITREVLASVEPVLRDEVRRRLAEHLPALAARLLRESDGEA